MVACTSSSRGGPVPRSGSELSSFVAEAPAIAQQACDKWASIWHGDTGAAPPLADVNSVESVANDATNHDLEFVVLRDHVHFVATAITNGDVGAMATAAERVDADCAYLKQGTFRAHINDAGST